MEFENRYHQSQRSKYDCLLFDLDDTLYPLSSGLSESCLKNIKGYMVEKLGIDESKIPNMCNLLYKNYGTTMAGLRAVGYEFDYTNYHSFVHGKLPYERLKPDPVLRNLLLTLPIRKVIFTNADKVHAVKALGRLGLQDCFEGIICFETLNPDDNSSNYCNNGETEFGHLYPTPNTCPFDIVGHFSHSSTSVDLPKTPIICKPFEYAFEQALKIANVKTPQRTLFFDDSVRNIQAAKNVGLHTVLVGTSQRSKGADYALESIHNIKEAMPELWEDPDKSQNMYCGKLAIETSVTA